MPRDNLLAITSKKLKVKIIKETKEQLIYQRFISIIMFYLFMSPILYVDNLNLAKQSLFNNLNILYLKVT